MNRNGYKTNLSPWQKAKKLSLVRNSPCGIYCGEPLDKGVNYFILVLEKLGCITEYSCEGHFKRKHQVPQLYISFIVPNKVILSRLKKALIKPCRLYHEYENTYTLRIDFINPAHKINVLNTLSIVWEKNLL